MRITLQLDDDLIYLARRLAQQRGSTMGRVVSDLARAALESKAARPVRNGVPLLTPIRGAGRPSLALVNQLRDDE